MTWGVLVGISLLIGVIWGHDQFADGSDAVWLSIGCALILFGLLIIRFGRLRLLAFVGCVLVVLGILSVLYVPILSLKSWVVWIQFVIVIVVLGLILLMKLWNPLTGLHNRLHKSSSSSSSSPPSSSSEIKVMSWNVFLRSVASQKFMDNDFKEERVVPIVGLVSESGADVVCLQEASSTLNYRVHRLIKAARRKGYRYCVCPAAPPIICRKMVDSGLLILSKLPIESADTVPLPSGLGDDALMHKAVQRAVIKSPHVCLLNTHVQSEYALDATRDHYSKIKARQYRRIADVVKRNVDDDDLPVVLCGDLNCDGIGDKDRCDRLRKTLGMASYVPLAQPTIDIRYDQETGAEIQTEFYVNPQSPSSVRGIVVPRAMDYIMCSKELSIKGSRVLDNNTNLDVRLSDHRPVLATLLKKRRR